MFRLLFGMFIVLHGLVHLWYVVLSQGLVKIKAGMPEVGWTGKSWLFTGPLGDTTTHLLAGILFSLAAIALVVSGVGIFARADWWSKILMGSALFSSVIIIMLWDGSMRLIMEKGLIGFLISLMIFLGLLLFKQPSSLFR